MRGDTPSLDEHGFRVNWVKLNNDLFGGICADPELRARYDAADWREAQLICSDQFDLLVSDAAEFVERYIIVGEDATNSSECT